jgi:SanA protein
MSVRKHAHTQNAGAYRENFQIRQGFTHRFLNVFSTFRQLGFFFGKIAFMFKKILKTTIKLAWYLVLIGAGIVFLAQLITGLVGWSRTHSREDVPQKPAAIVFGAGLTPSGGPSAVMRDRVRTASELYFAGKVQKLLMSGDNSTIYYNEPAAMRNYAVSLGVPEEDIVLDYAGRRTYDTCYRAHAIFGLEQAILVTQDFHMPRALYLCNALGVDSVGVQADNYRFRRVSLTYWRIRELGATVNALLDVHLLRPLPILGDPEPIFNVDFPLPRQDSEATIRRDVKHINQLEEAKQE